MLKNLAMVPDWWRVCRLAWVHTVTTDMVAPDMATAPGTPGIATSETITPEAPGMATADTMTPETPGMATTHTLYDFSRTEREKL